MPESRIRQVRDENGQRGGRLPLQLDDFHAPLCPPDTDNGRRGFHRHGGALVAEKLQGVKHGLSVGHLEGRTLLAPGLVHAETADCDLRPFAHGDHVFAVEPEPAPGSFESEEGITLVEPVTGRAVVSLSQALPGHDHVPDDRLDDARGLSGRGDEGVFYPDALQFFGKFPRTLAPASGGLKAGREEESHPRPEEGGDQQNHDVSVFHGLSP